ncbi:MAG: TorF family putative porin [Gammaproteobacteria bacterium]|nr:TorF family putative porin [Gammaproteobacteria bacterium]MDT8370818.1 TorF family putative porin [Gammaproteobacteria bacterium]
MKLKKLSTLCLTASTLFAASSAMAWESADGAWSTSASVALSTDYIWRGVSQTDNEAAISGSFDIGHSSGLYAGVWASNVDFEATPDNATIEVDYYAGFAGEFGGSGVGYDIGALYYDYPDADSADFFEVHGSLSYSFITAGIAYSDDVFGTDTDGTYYTVDAGYDIGMFSLAAGIGYYDFDDEVAAGLDSYTSYHVGASTELAGFGLDLSYYDVDDNAISDASSDNIVFTLSKSM